MSLPAGQRLPTSAGAATGVTLSTCFTVVTPSGVAPPGEGGGGVGGAALDDAQLARQNRAASAVKTAPAAEPSAHGRRRMPTLGYPIGA